MDELYYMTTKREMALKDLGYQYKCIWEHEFNRQLKNDAANTKKGRGKEGVLRTKHAYIPSKIVVFHSFSWLWLLNFVK
jgi:hypothetical protein